MVGVIANLSSQQRLEMRGWVTTPTACWEVNGHVGTGGYKYIRIDGKRQGVHRVAYETWVGPIPKGHLIRHRCDNPPCINPQHLETGTNWDNRHDSVIRKRTPWGERHWKAILSDSDVQDIKQEYVKGFLTHKMIAEVYGVSRTTISKRLSEKEELL